MSAADHEAAIREEADFITSISWPSSGIPAGCDKIKEHAAALVGLLQQAEQRAERLEGCDCVPVVISSRSCPKCGRRGVAFDDWLTQMKDAVARAEQAEQERDEREAGAKWQYEMGKAWKERCDRAEEALREIEPLIDAQFDGHATTAEYMEKVGKLNDALDIARRALAAAAPPEEVV
jgi:hypothetical protein